MKFATRKLRSPLKWHGGKAYLARRIIEFFPDHETYVEPFAGGLNVLLNKRPSAVEVAGDLNVGLMNFYRVLTGGTDRLRRLLEMLPYSQGTFDAATELMADPTPLKWATGFLVRNRMSRGGMGKTFAWSDRLRGGLPGDLNAWHTILDELPALAERLAKVYFVEGDYSVVLGSFDSPKSLFYCDPPYLHETRTAKAVYDHEMHADRHSELLERLDRLEGHVVLSGYPSRLYDERLKHWGRFQFDMPNHAGQGRQKQRRTEVIWIKGASQ